VPLCPVRRSGGDTERAWIRRHRPGPLGEGRPFRDTHALDHHRRLEVAIRTIALWQHRFGLHQLDPISKGVIDKDSVVSLQRSVRGKLVTGLFQMADQALEIIDDKSRMSLSRRREILLDPQVNLQLARLEPASASRRELRRLDDFGDAEDFLIEGSRVVLPPGRHGKQNVIDPANPRHLVQQPRQMLLSLVVSSLSRSSDAALI
jgi:hypothetical protein